MLNDPNSPFRGVVGLGALKSEHPRRGSRWPAVIFGVIFIAAAPVLALVALFLGFEAYSQHGLMRVDDGPVIPLLVIAVIGFVIGALVLFNAWRTWPLAAVLYEDGLAVNRRQGLQVVRWNQVDWVKQAITRHYYNGVYTGTTHLYTIATQDQVKIQLSDQLSKIEDLGKAVQQGVSGALWPRYLRALQAGQRLTFGPLGLDSQKLYSGNKELPWSEIKAISIKKGIISVKKEKGWFNWASVTVPQIPNFFIFLEIAGRFTNLE